VEFLSGCFDPYLLYGNSSSLRPFLLSFDPERNQDLRLPRQQTPRLRDLMTEEEALLKKEELHFDAFGGL